MKIITYLLYILDRLFKKPNLDNGFISVKPTDTDYIHKEGSFGFVSKSKLLPDKNWKRFRSKAEKQKREQRETMACVTFSAMNALEELVNFYLQDDKDESKEIANIFKQFGLIKDGEADFSDRYIAKLSGTTIRGNSQSRVANAIRHYGLVPEDMWGWDTDNYYANVSKNVIAKGKELLEYIEFKYEWVNPSEFNDVKIYAPIQTSMYYRPPSIKNGIYQYTGLRKNHAVVNDCYEDKKYDGIYNTYEPFDEKVAWNFNLGMGMLFTIKLKKKLPNPVDKFVEDFDGKNVKHKDSPAVYFIQKGLKKAYPDEITYLAFNVNDKQITKYNLIDKDILDKVSDGDNMQIEKSRYWDFLKHIKGNNERLRKLIEIIAKSD